MRREGVYSSLLSNWRKQLANGAVPKRGRPPQPEAVEVARLRKDNERLRRRLEKSERTVDALGKARALADDRRREQRGRRAVETIVVERHKPSVLARRAVYSVRHGRRSTVTAPSRHR
jgi:transposase-like protein